MNSEIKTGIILAAVIVVGLVVIGAWFTTLDQQHPATVTTTIIETDDGPIQTIDKSKFKKAPDIKGIAEYLNTTPEQLKTEIDGKVVLYDIWTYSCINCIRTLPYITAWDEKYSDEGLLIIGVHSPEFEFEKDPQNVRAAMEKHGISYPVVMDNDMETWKAFENRYWPRKYIADHEGFIRYDHIGEGGYQESEKMIQQLLKERSDALGMQMDTESSLVDIAEFEHTIFRTPELYFGYTFAQNRNQLGSSEGFQPGRTVSYAEPDRVDLHKFYPVGDWKNHDASMELISEEGIIRLQYSAKEVNIVTENSAEITILVDGKPVAAKHIGTDVTADGMLLADKAGLYNIINSDTSTTGEIELKISGKGFHIFTFTFG